MPEGYPEKLGVEGVNRIWRDAKLRGGRNEEGQRPWYRAAEYSVGSKEAPEAARLELRNLLNDMDVYASRVGRTAGNDRRKTERDLIYRQTDGGLRELD